MNKQTAKLMLLGGNILAIIGCFLPFVSVWGFSVPFIDGDGKIVVVACIVSIVLAFIKAKLASIANIIALIVVVVDIANAGDLALDLLAIGAYVIIIANIIAIIGSIKSKKA